MVPLLLITLKEEMFENAKAANGKLLAWVDNGGVIDVAALNLPYSKQMLDTKRKMSSSN